MSGRTTGSCPHVDAVAALARGRLHGEAERREQAHLEHCEPCRMLFRRDTAEIFPKIRNYTIVEHVGKGGFGMVYRAIHHGKQRTEALKVHGGRHLVRARYFENEVHLIARLSHPNIATLYEANLGANPPYYAMEFVEGENLDDHLRKREITLRERIEIVRTVAEAIGHAHDQGVLHRDIKPQNIMIDRQGRPRIVDFGISKRLGMTDSGEDIAGTPSSDATPEGAVGTLGYIAPEQLAGEAVDARADIYALGALLFHCITGEAAKLARRREHCLLALRTRRVSRADDLAAIIARCSDPLPANRYGSCGALVADLDNYLRSWVIAAIERPSARYRAARVASFLLRNYPAPVRVAAIVAVTALLSFSYSQVGARALIAGVAGTDVMLVAFTPETLAAIRDGRIGKDLSGLSADDRKSWRLLHARLTAALDRGGARVIAWDYYFPDAQPDFDPPFAAAIRNCRAPVVVGSKRFDEDSQPVISAFLADIVHSVGTLVGVDPRARADEYIVPLALVRGYEAPIPSLSVAAFAAARFPDSAPVLHLQPNGVELRYRRRAAAGAARRFREETDPLPVFDVDREATGVDLDTGDQTPLVRFPAVPRGHWDAHTVAYEVALSADDERLRGWFAGKLVMIGEMTPGQDQWPVPGAAGASGVFGCQVQALALQSLLTGQYLRPFSRWEVLWRVLAWCAGGAAVAAAIGPKLRRVRMHWVALGALAALLAALAQAGYVSAWITERGWVEASFAVAGLLACGGLCLALEVARQRQLELVPGEGLTKASGSTLSSTLVRETKSDSTAPSGGFDLPPA